MPTIFVDCPSPVATESGLGAPDFTSEFLDVDFGTNYQSGFIAGLVTEAGFGIPDFTAEFLGMDFGSNYLSGAIIELLTVFPFRRSSAPIVRVVDDQNNAIPTGRVRP